MDTRRTGLIRTAYAAAFALLFAASFPFRVGEVHYDLGRACGWIAVVPFALLIRDLRPRAAFVWGTAAGTAAFTGVLFWIYVVVAVHGGAPPIAAVLLVLLMAAANGAHLGAVAAIARALEGGWARLLVLPAAWVAVEHFKGTVPFGGFPWGFLGYSAHENDLVRELAAIGGVYGLSFVLVGFAGLLSERRWMSALGVLVAAHAAGFALGMAAMRAPQPPAAHAVGIVQGNIPQDLKWDPGFAQESFDLHLEISRLAAAAGELDLIVWPEAAVSFPLSSGKHREAISALARETGASLLVGGVAVESSVASPRWPLDYGFYNSVFIVTPDGQFQGRYDKSKLVPFGEYLPLRSVLGIFVDAVATGAALADMSAGPGPTALDDLPGYGSDAALSPLICYEVIYPSLVRRAVQSGARVLVNATNDAWYDRTSAPEQFLAIAALRSAEHGLPMVRAANTGVSAFVDASGRVLQQTPLFERRALVAALPAARRGPTLYTRLGDWVVWGSWALLLVLGGMRLVGRRGRPGDPRRAQGPA